MPRAHPSALQTLNWRPHAAAPLCRCINETEGVLLSAPINGTGQSAFFCNRYRIVGNGAQASRDRMSIVCHLC